MTGLFRNEIVHVVCALLVPFVLLFGIYVVVHGHYSPGGGFTGGVIFGVGVILLRLYADEDTARRRFRPTWAIGGALVGILLFLLIGLAPMLTGAVFLDYARMPLLGLAAVELRYLGILVVELAIGFAVAGVMVLLFDVLAEGRT